MEAPIRSWAHYIYDKWQRKTKRQEKVKNASLGVLVLMTGLWPDLKDILNWRQNCSKNKLVSENAVTRRYKKCSLRGMGSWLQRIIIRSVQFTYPSQRLTIPSLAQTQNIFFIYVPLLSPIWRADPWILQQRWDTINSNFRSKLPCVTDRRNFILRFW